MADSTTSITLKKRLTITAATTAVVALSSAISNAQPLTSEAVTASEAAKTLKSVETASDAEILELLSEIEAMVSAESGMNTPKVAVTPSPGAYTDYYFDGGKGTAPAGYSDAPPSYGDSGGK